jgi:tetratricopeptide (TPR) repeat protein
MRPGLHLVFALSVLAIAAAGCSKQDDSKEARLNRAKEAFAAGQYSKAETEYREVLRLAPSDAVAMRELGIIYFDQGQLRQAYPLLQQSAEKTPDDWELQLKLGLTYLGGGDRKQAREAALRILDKQPGHEDALLLLVDSARTPEEIEDARKLIASLRGKDQDRAGYHLALGALDLRQQNDARAESEFKAALNLSPKSSATHAALAKLYWHRQDLKAADAAFKDAAELSAPRSPVRLQYAEFKLRTGAPADAAKIVDDVLQKAPDYLPARVFSMQLACQEKRDDNCAARVQRVLAQDSSNFDALFQSGLLSLAKGEATEAIRVFEHLSSSYGPHPQVRLQLAVAYLLFARTATGLNARNAVDGAEKSLTEAVKLDPRLDQAALLLAELKIRKGSPAAAVDLLEPLIKERPQIAQAHYLLASAYLAQRQANQALAVYRRMTELFPQDPQPSFLIGGVLLAQGRQADARKSFEKAVEISPDYLPAVEGLVNFDIAEKQYAAAVARVQKIIDKDPKLAQAWVVRGKIYLAQQDFTRAEQDLQKAIELNANLEPAYLLLAQLYVTSNKQEQAIERLNAFVEKNKTVPALMQLAMIQQSVKNYEASRDAYEKLLAVSPQFAVALNNLAVLYSEHFGQIDKAHELAKRAREAAPNVPQMADTLGWILFKKGEYDNALRLLQESAGKLPDNPEIQFHLGMAHYMLGEEGPARLALQKAAEASADFPGKDEARRRLALLAIEAGTANAALRGELENVLRERPNDPVALARLARLHEQEGAAGEAIKTYEKIVDANPLFAPALRRLALFYGERSPGHPKAQDVAAKARRAYPDDPQIADALGWILFRKGEYRNALQLLQESAGKLADEPAVQFHLGMAHYMLGDEAPARSALAKAAEAADFPGKEEARRRLSVLAIDAATASAAVRAELTNYLREQPNDPAALLRLAKVQERDGAAGEAIKTYERIVDQNPLYAPALKQLAILSSQRSSDVSKAYELAEKARSAYPGDAEVSKALGILNYRRGYYPQSVEQLRQAAAARANDAELLYYLGAAYHQLKQSRECRDALQRALDLNLSPGLAGEAKRALADCAEAAPR